MAVEITSGEKPIELVVMLGFNKQHAMRQQNYKNEKDYNEKK
jgi:hypothetical protein